MLCPFAVMRFVPLESDLNHHIAARNSCANHLIIRYYGCYTPVFIIRRSCGINAVFAAQFL